MDDHDSYQYPRNSISTFDSECSTKTAPSIFSVARSNSRASDITTYSHHSLPSAPSFSSLDVLQRSISSSPSIRDRPPASIEQIPTQNIHDPRRAAAIRAATKRVASQSDSSLTSPTLPPSTLSTCGQTIPLAEKQATNKYACSHCPEVFTKKSDRKKHWLHRCQYLGDPTTLVGDGLVCPGCEHVARNVPQQDRHRKISGHEGEWEKIRLCKKERYTCSTHQTIYLNAETFYAHFGSHDCPLNNHSGGKDGYRHAQARIATLLQEGKDQLYGNHTYLYRALVAYCNAHGLREQDWQGIVKLHPAGEALTLASKLEWGIRPADGSALSRLGFTNEMEMVAAAVPRPSIDVHSPERRLDDQAADFRDRATCFPQIRQEIMLGQVQKVQPQARFVERIQENVAHSATPRRYGATHWQPHQDAQWDGRGFAVHTTQPLPTETIASHANDRLHLRADPHPDPNGLQQHSDIEAVWDQGMGRMALRDAWSTEMKLSESAPPLFLHHAFQNPRIDDGLVDGSWSQVFTALEPWTQPAAQNLHAKDDDYPDRQALTPSSPVLMSSTKKAKRPISKNSAILPDSITRAKVGPRQTLALRPSFKDLSTIVQFAHLSETPPRSTKRGSGESVVGKFFNYDEYYNQCPDPSLLLLGTKSGCSDFTQQSDQPHTSTSSERIRAPGEAVKAVLRKITTPSIREIGDDTPASQLRMPRSSARSRSRLNSSQCTHCGKVDNISCFTDHISNEHNSRTSHRRRNGSVYNPADVAQAFQHFEGSGFFFGQ